MRLEGKIECRDLVVFVPGLMGSVLEKDGKPLWRPGSKMGLRALLTGGKSLDLLRLQQDSLTEDDVDGVVATGVLDAVHMIPGLWKIDSYGPVLKNLRERLTVVPGENYLQFAYDWRRDIRYCSRRLGRAIETRLAAWRQKSGNSDAQAVIIAHSLGGLVSRYYLESLGGWLTTRTLVTLGTPHRGALSGIKYLVNGETKGIGPFQYDFSEFVKSCTTCYQMLPIWECYDNGDGVLRRPGEVAIPGVDADRAAAGLAFFRELQDAVESNRRDPRWEEQGYELCPVVGTRQRTAISARLENGRVVTSDSIKGQQIDGDATVSRVSATPIELSRANREVFVAAKHSVMHNAPEVIHHIEGMISGTSVDLALFFGDSEVELGLELDDLYCEGESFTAKVEATDEPGDLEVVVTPAAGGDAVHRQTLAKADISQSVEIPELREGTYRIRISGGEGVHPIEDVFEVIGDLG